MTDIRSPHRECHVGTRALPTLANAALDTAESLLGRLGVNLGGKRRPLRILKDVSGVVRPSRMTLLLGPPSSGKTTLLLALAGKLDPSLEVSVLTNLMSSFARLWLMACSS